MLVTRTLAKAPTDSGLAPVPGDGGLPLLGHGLDYLRDPMRLWEKRYHRYGPVSWFRAFGTRIVALLGPEASGVVLQNRDKAFANGEAWQFLIGPFFDRGLMLLDFDEHMAHRRLMQEAFTSDRLARYAAAIDPAVRSAVEQWQPGERVEVYPRLKQLTLNLAVEVFMGGAPGASQARLDQVNSAFIDCVQAATALVRYPVPGGRWHRGLVGRRRVEEFLREYLPARRAGDGDDLFSVLCRVEVDGERFSDDDVINHMIFLLMAAHDTTTSTVTSMVYELGRDVQWQERLRRQCQDLGPNPTMAELEELPDLALVMKESLRLHPPVPVMARKAVKDTEILGVEIPVGRLTSIMPLYSHHMPEYWTDPEIFDPERFSDERREDKSHRFAWEPFGGGVHKCLGIIFANLESKLVLSALLRHFEWSVPLAYVPPMKNDSLPYPADGLPVSLRPLARVAAN